MSSPPPSSEIFERPEFKPDIPEHLLKSCNDQQRFLLERISVITQNQAWQMDKVGETHIYCKTINGKVIELEKFKQAVETQQAVEKGSLKLKRWAWVLSLALIYPIYLASISKVGLVEFLMGLVSS
jgi:hypothetical protein